MTTQYRLLRWMGLTAALALALAATITRPGAAHASQEPVRVERRASTVALSQLSTSAASAAEQQVKIDNFSFIPKRLTVSVGTTVTWTNHDDVPHTVVSTKKVFASPALDTDQQFSFRFTAPGTYAYYCSVHPMMTGTVVVK